MKDTRGSLTRRNMLIASGGAVAVLGVGIAPSASAAVSGNTPLRGLAGIGANGLAAAGHAEWAAAVGSTFAVVGAQRLALAEVRPLESRGPRPAGARDRAFVAKFDVVGGRLPGDRIYTVSHPQHGPMQIFLTGGGDDGRMQAVFN